MPVLGYTRNDFGLKAEVLESQEGYENYLDLGEIQYQPLLITTHVEFRIWKVNQYGDILQEWTDGVPWQESSGYLEEEPVLIEGLDLLYPHSAYYLAQKLFDSVSLICTYDSYPYSVYYDLTTPFYRLNERIIDAVTGKPFSPGSFVVRLVSERVPETPVFVQGLSQYHEWDKVFLADDKEMIDGVVLTNQPDDTERQVKIPLGKIIEGRFQHLGVGDYRSITVDEYQEIEPDIVRIDFDAGFSSVVGQFIITITGKKYFLPD
jgi:hypothetical protein